MTLSNNHNNSNSSEPSSQHLFDYALLFHQQQEQLIVSVSATSAVKNNGATSNHHHEQHSEYSSSSSSSAQQQQGFDHHLYDEDEDVMSDVKEDEQQLWMNNMMMKKKGDYLRIGEEISFYTDLSSKSTGNSMIGFLSVDGINLTCSENVKGNKPQARCGLVESVISEKDSSFFTPNFSNCVFKICHPKSYSALKKFKTFKEEQELKEANKKTKDNKNNVMPSTASFSTEYQQLEQRAERELEQNRMESQRNLSKPVVYGQTVQLYHVQTQCYLTVARESAEMQKDCMRLALDKEGSTYSYFQIMPYSSFQKDGDQVKLTDQIRLYNKKSNQFIHLSYYRYTTGEDNDGTYQRVNENSSYTELAQQAVKLSRNRGKYSYDSRREVNMANSTAFTRWRMKLYQKYTPQNDETNRKLKAGSTIMRIYHKELEGYIGVNEKTDRIKFFKKSSNLQINDSEDTSLAGMESKSSDYVSPQTLWQLEFLDSSCSGTVKWTSKFRLRHLASGKYMVIRPIKGITIEADDAIEERYERENTPTSGDNLSQLGVNAPRKSSIVATPRGNRSGSVTQNDSLWTLHVENFDDLITQPIPTSVFHFTDSTGGQKKGEKVQTTDYFRLRHEATNSWVHISRPLADSTYQRVTSSLKMFEQDVFNFSAVSHEDLNDALTVAGYMPIIRYFKSKLDDSLIDKSDIKLYIGALANCIRFCTISEETDPLTRGGIPVKLRQNIIRDMGVIGLVMENITLLLKKYLSIEDLSLIYEKPEKALYFDVVQYSFRLIRQFVLSNESNGLYMAQYINFIQTLIEHSIAASEALLEILSNNYPLLNKITESQIDFFVKLLFENTSKIGMRQSSKSLKKAVYLSFLTSLIICEGKTVVKNQVYIGNLLFSKYKDQLRRVFIIPKLNNEDKVVVEVNHDEIDLISFSQSATDDTYNGYTRPNYEQLIFFQEEIRLFAALCTGRNEEIEDARRSVVSLFTYEVVHKCVSDKNLTPAVRTSFVKLLIQTFIDTEKREKKPLIDYTRKTSTLNQRSKEDGNSKDLAEIKDFLGKFLRENVSLDVSLEKKDHNNFTLYVVIMCKRMLEFGVLTLIDFEEGDLLNSLFDMLRGDNDKKDGRILSEEERHKNVEENLTLMKIKIEIASIFHMILDIILDKRVTKFLQFFWKKYREEEIETVLREQEVIPMDNRALQQKRLAEIDSNEYAVIKDILEKDVIFNKMDRFDVKILSLTKYENKELATTCLDLLIRKYRSAQELCEVLPKIELIVSREMAKSYDLLLSQVVELRSVFGYGQSNYFGTRRLTEQEEKKVLKALNEILSDIKKNGQRSQRIVRNLFIYDIILTFLKKDYIVSKEIEEIGIDILIAFVRGNQDNQKIMFKQLEFFIHTIGENRSLDKKIVILLCEMVRDNRGLCSTIEEKLIEHYIDQIAEQPCSFMLLFLHVILGTNNGNPIKRNQSLITKYLLERKKDIMILFKDEEGLRERNQRIIKGEHKTEPDGILNYHIALLYLLASLADGKNRESELKLQTLYSYEELLEQVICCTLPVLRNPLVKVIDEIYLNVEKASDDSTESESKMVNVHHPMLFKLFSKMVTELEVLEMTYSNESDGNDLILSTQKGERQSIMHAHTRTPTTPSKTLSNTSLFATPTKNRGLSTTASKRSSKTYSVALPKVVGPSEEDQETYQVDNTYLFDIMIPCVRDYFHLHFPPPNLTKEQLDIAEDLLIKLIELHKHTPNPENRDKVLKCIQAMLKRSMSSTSQKAISNFISNKATKAKVHRSRIQTSTSTEKDELIHNTYKKYLKDRIISKINRNFSNFSELAAIFIKYDGFIKTLVNVLRDLNSSGLLLQNMKVGLFGMDILKSIVERQNQQTEESTLKLDLVEKKIPEVVIEFLNSNHHQIAKSALELGILILNDGDLDVQNHIYSLLTDQDSTEFFMSLRDRIRLSKIEIKQMKNHLKKKRDKELALANQKKSTTNLNADHDNEEDEVGVEFVEKGFIFNTMEFLRLLCEGHNTKNQALLKHQPRNIFSFDLITEIIEYLIALEKKLDADNVQVAIQGFKTLTEFVQGPAVFNQNLIGTSNKIYPRLINEIMSKTYDDSKLLKEQELDLKKEITLFLISLLEGRNTVTLEFMKNSLNLDDFEQKLLYILRLFETLSGNNHDDCDDLERLKKRMRKDFGFHVLYQSEKSSKKPIRVDDYMEDNLEKIRLQYDDLGTHIFFLLSMIRDSETEFRKGTQALEEESRVANFFQTNSKELSYFKQRTGSIEVLRNNVLEKIYFPKPTICNNIIDKARSNYANSLHVMTPQEKVRKLYNDTFSTFYVEMCHYENMKKTFTIPNLNKKEEEEPEEEMENLLPSMSLVATTSNLLAKRKKKKKQEVKTASWEYIANWWDYLRLSSFFLSVIINIIVLGTFKRIYATTEYSQIPLPGSDFDVYALTKTTAPRNLASDIILIIVGVTQLIFLVILFVIYVSLFLTLEVKKRFKLKKNETWDSIPRDFDFMTKCFLYTIQDSQIWYFIIYIVVSVIGLLITPIIYSIQLFEMVYIFKSLTDVLKSVTSNVKRLFFTGMLLCIALFFFGTLYFTFFSSDFKISKTGDKTCEDMLACYVTMLDYGFRGESFWEDIYDPNVSVQRAILDLSFLVIVIVLLVNVVFGVILDSFEVLRNEREDRKKDIRDKCFICGLERTKFDTRANEGITFEKHVKEEHYLWNYVYFLIYLYQKSVTEFTGTEQYIYDRCEDNDDVTSFFPIFRSLSLEQSEQSSKVE
ncbi:predicted protein [Naegleria gruberi]|uniref:Predicted protein n=1 Tax=Naegleria gruberi TaxID=5762 RepID=D2VTL3_NAEGR|nr:uncharacterized protein NAEGRDRAFT_52142 [Naegleria gruberi]EFC39952.1 predicted protein [Naegleria gruberi]|eukprot:XP_002672696.1 predicted protein [Naegleria gruberi strain NEG-M]